MRADLREKVALLPRAPGVYLLKDANGSVFYVGKAKDLRARVRSYFSGADTRAFVERIDEYLDDLEVVLTDSESEALLVENDLIKRYRPRFNIKLTDDKHYLRLRLDERAAFPRLEVVRRERDDGARYFGPYASASAIRETLRLVNRVFQLRTCSDHVMATRSRPCLQHQIGRCPAPCVGLADAAFYAENVAAVRGFLAGDARAVLATLEARMREVAEALEFERAAALRDQAAAIRRSIQRQTLARAGSPDREAIGLYREGDAVAIHVLRTRRGAVAEARRYLLVGVALSDGDVLAEFATQYLTEHARDLPREMLFAEAMEWGRPLVDFARRTFGARLVVRTPRRGDGRRLVELAERNARQAFEETLRARGVVEDAVGRLKRALGLRRPPMRIECFDISHHQGEAIVASAIRFEDGVPVRQRYRRYALRSVSEQDDFRSMYEVVSRRLRRGVEEGDLPDLLLIDGGKGQLAAARAAMTDYGVDDLDIVAIAKSRPKERGSAAGATPAARSPERLFVLGQKNPIVLRQGAPELVLLTRARDEAHRFAIAYHRKRRRGAYRRSSLEGIPGVGPARRRLLLRRFGSVEGVASAPHGELAAAVGAALAERIRQAFAKTAVEEGNE